MSKVAGISDDELEGLSAEERAALEDNDDDAEDIAAIAGDDKADDKAGDNADADADAEAEAKAKADAKAEAEAKKKRDDELAEMDENERAAAEAADKVAADKAAADAAAKKKAEEDAAASTTETDDATGITAAIPRYKVAPVEDYQGKIKAIDSEFAELDASFRAGDIEVEDLHTKRAEIQARRDDLLALKIKGDMAADFNTNAEAAEWQMQCSYFVRTVKSRDGIDYSKDVVKVEGKEVPLFGELNKMVKVLANMQENADKNGDWFLREADSIVRARYGLASKRADAAPAKKEVKLTGRRPDLKSVPKTLGGLPAAGGGDAGDDSDGEFAALDKLSGLELENAVARMTPDQQKRYAEAA